MARKMPIMWTQALDALTASLTEWSRSALVGMAVTRLAAQLAEEASAARYVADAYPAALRAYTDQLDATAEQTTLHVVDATEADFQAIGRALERLGATAGLRGAKGYNRRLMIFLALYDLDANKSPAGGAGLQASA